MIEYINMAASVATAIGVLIAIVQLWHARKLAVTQFEDHMADQYRQLLRSIPVRALLGHELPAVEQEQALGAFLHYFDLSNDQAFLHRQGRITATTWAQWRDGITDHFERRAFRDAWVTVSERMPESFEDLRAVLAAQSELGVEHRLALANESAQGVSPSAEAKPETSLATSRRRAASKP